MSKHTPGPWEFEWSKSTDRHVVTATDESGDIELVADVTNCHNAALIAAAPDMLKALERALPVLRAHEPNYRGCDVEAPSEEVHAAIAKAKGEA